MFCSWEGERRVRWVWGELYRGQQDFSKNILVRKVGRYWVLGTRWALGTPVKKVAAQWLNLP